MCVHTAGVLRRKQVVGWGALRLSGAPSQAPPPQLLFDDDDARLTAHPPAHTHVQQHSPPVESRLAPPPGSMRQYGSEPHYTPPPPGVNVGGRSPTPPEASPSSAEEAEAEGPLSPIAAETPTLQSAHDPSTPTRRGGPKKVDVLGQQSDGTKLAADLPAATQIPPEAAHWVSVLGESIVRNLHSPDWKTREFGLQAINRSLSNSKWLSERQAINVWRVVTELLDGCLQ